MKQILIVEDDVSLGTGLGKALSKEDVQTVVCNNIKDAKEQLLVSDPSLIVLDINLPDGNGLELMHEIRQQHSDTPIIVLTANDTDADVVQGLELGADDYITKPFSLAVLRARVNKQLEKRDQHNSSRMSFDNYSFDFSNMVFCVDGMHVELSKTEQRLLRLLAENRGHVLSREKLIDRIWTDGADYVDENALSVAVKRLRDKLNAQEYIKTIYGVGYTWVK